MPVTQPRDTEILLPTDLARHTFVTHDKTTVSLSLPTDTSISRENQISQYNSVLVLDVSDSDAD